MTLQEPCGTQTAQQIQRDVIDALTQREARRSEEQRSLVYDLATEDEYRPLHTWSVQRLSQLPRSIAEEKAQMLWSDEHHQSMRIELLTGEILENAGLTASQVHRWSQADAAKGEKTPDFTVLVDGRAAALVEVICMNPSRAAKVYSVLRPWYRLSRMIRRIPVDVVLWPAPGTDLTRPPNDQQIKGIAREIREWLLDPGPKTSAWIGANLARSFATYGKFRGDLPRLPTTSGYTFVVAANPTGRSWTMPSPHVGRAHLDPLGCSVSAVASGRIKKSVDTKIGAQSEVAKRHRLPLVVALGSHPFVGLSVADLDALLKGELSYTAQLETLDLFEKNETVVPMKLRPWRIPGQLAGLMWIDNRLPARGYWRPNPRAQRAVPTKLFEGI